MGLILIISTLYVLINFMQTYIKNKNYSLSPNGPAMKKCIADFECIKNGVGHILHISDSIHVSVSVLMLI